MRGFVQVDEEKDYLDWLAKQISFDKMLAKKELNKTRFSIEQLTESDRTGILSVFTMVRESSNSL